MKFINHGNFVNPINYADFIDLIKLNNFIKFNLNFVDRNSVNLNFLYIN